MAFPIDVFFYFLMFLVFLSASIDVFSIIDGLYTIWWIVPYFPSNSVSRTLCAVVVFLEALPNIVRYSTLLPVPQRETRFHRG